MNLNGRITKIEQSLDPIPTKQTGPQWAALGLLLEHGPDVMRHAAGLLQSGDVASLKNLWVEIAALEPNRTQPSQAQLNWAVTALGDILPYWQSLPWWDEVATCQALLADIDNEIITQRAVTYGDGAHAYYVPEAEPGPALDRLKWVVGEVIQAARVTGWQSSDRADRGATHWPDQPHTIDELKQWVVALENFYTCRKNEVTSWDTHDNN